jgi:hypothetical protein
MYIGYVHGFRYIGIGPIAIWMRGKHTGRTAWNAGYRWLRPITRWVRIAPRYRALEV